MSSAFFLGLGLGLVVGAILGALGLIWLVYHLITREFNCP